MPSNVATYKGSDREKVLDRFQAQYLKLAAELPDGVRDIVDGILNENDRPGFENVQTEREAAERHARERVHERDRAAAR